MKIRLLLNTMALAGLAAATLGLGVLRADDPTVRITSDEARKAAVTRVEPAYPPLAKQMHLSGKVELDAIIDPDGNVDDVKILNGNPLLTGAASQAMKHWKFHPIQVGGKAVRAVAAFTFDFKM